MSILVWGPSGCGKSHVGRALAERMCADFVDADDLHPKPNVIKMARGEPLDDADRAPWLAHVAACLAEWHRAGVCGIMACSALKRSYRDTLRVADPRLVAVLLQIGPDAARDRLISRRGHFMPVTLIASQFATFEMPAAEEHCLVIDSTGGVEETAHLIHEAMHRQT